MSGSLRYILAALFVALYFLVPAPDDPESQRYLTQLQVRSALLDTGSDGLQNALLTGATEDGAEQVAPLEVVVLPPLEDRDAAAAERAGYERAQNEWIRARTAGGNPTAVDAGQSPVQLEVRIGTDGYRFLLGLEGQTPKSATFPSRTSLLPPFLAIAVAIVTGWVIPALLLGCLVGAWFIADQQVLEGLRYYAVEILWSDVLGQGDLLGDDGFNLRVTAFVIFLFMAVGIMSRSGGIQGMVTWVSRFARGPVSTQICTWIIGLLIFFDDYANCIVTGTTMRPLSDRNGVSREKLSYIVDSTAAPIAGISLFSTWVAYEVSQFRSQLPEVTNPEGVPYTTGDAFSVFVGTLPYRFYCLFTIAAVALTILLKREWGPMLTAERRARLEGKPVADDAQPMVSKKMAELEPRDETPKRGWNALAPILLLVTLTVTLIFWFGMPAGAAQEAAYAATDGLMEQVQWIMGNSASERALLWASLSALVLAAALAMGQRIMKPMEVVRSALHSAHSLVFAIMILLLAWSIGATCKALGTNFFLTAGLGGSLEPLLLPCLLFLMSGLVAFSTGTSYGTMAILLPNVVVLAHRLGEQVPELGGPALMILTIGAVLEGSIFGDHCSPISDTTVLSSLGTGSDHLHHVQTQAPYAVLTMVITLLLGYLPVVLIGPHVWWLSWILGLAGLGAFLLIVGKDPGKPASTP